MTAGRFVQVVLPLPLFQRLTYAVPAGMAMPERGARVLVPVRGRRAIGIAMGPGSGDGVRSP